MGYHPPGNVGGSLGAYTFALVASTLSANCRWHRLAAGCEMEGNRRRAIYLIIAISALALASISAQAADTGQEVENSSIEPPYVEVPKDHIAMHRAVIEARRTVGEFVAALQHPAPGQQDFRSQKAVYSERPGRTYLAVGCAVRRQPIPRPGR